MSNACLEIPQIINEELMSKNIIHKFSKALYNTSNLLLLSVLLILASCARMGNPDGGWYDDTPPRIIGTYPKEKAVNVKENKFTIYFDEFIKLEDATNKVIVSPPQLEMPEIKAAGKKIVGELKDTLKENTTYTIDFSDAITDNNENNPMGNYTYCFSTGNDIDTFEVAGTVLDASNLEPIKGISVGLYDDLSDTVFKNKPMIRISRTDSRGRFAIKGVAPGTYRVYALQDMDGDFKYSQKSEMIAFNQQTYVPSCGPDVRQDTVWRDSLRIDSIIRVPYIHYYPDNVVLTAFTHKQTDRYLLKTERKDPEKFTLYFTYGSDSLPVIRGLNFNTDSAFVIEATADNDTITYWLRDTMLVNQDTLLFDLQYMATDSTGMLVSRTDTLEALAKTSYEKRKKQLEKEIEDWYKKQEKAKKRGKEYDSIMPIKYLEVSVKSSSSHDPDKNIQIEMPVPLLKCDTSGVNLYYKIDSLWYRAEFEMSQIEGQLRQYEIKAEWLPEVEYSLEFDSAIFESIYGLVNAPIKKGIKVRSLEEYSTLMVNVSGIDDTCLVVQIINNSDAPVKQSKVIDGTAEFYYVNPGKYYLRAFSDKNGNGIWDTGDYEINLQPEAVYYNPKEIECKAKWDITHDWNITAVPLNKQKPMAITKQKPDKEKQLRNRNFDRAKELGIEYVKGMQFK